MTNQRSYLLTGALAVLFTLLFYHQSFGLNLLLFEIFLVPLMLFLSPGKPYTVNGVALTAGIAVTALFTLLHASAFVITMNLVALFLWTGWLLLPGGRSLVSIAALAFGNLALAPLHAVARLLDENGKHPRTHHRIRQVAYFILPLFLVFLFLLIYSVSSPYFARLMDNVLRYPFKWLGVILESLNFDLAFVLLLGVWTAILFVFRRRKERIPDFDQNAGELLFRHKPERRIRGFRMLALKSEARAGIFLLIMLNLLIFLQNLLDIWFVWFHFEWNGQYLRQFVHEGTYLLIVSVLISIGIILWIYRGNLNFLPGNRLLKGLSYAWLVQNMVLVISVAVRNGWYICYFALAYKRIGVFIFLGLTLVGLITVLIKVSRFKTLFYLMRVNTFAAFVLLVLASLVNWDVVIARYNFSQYRSAFVHLDWLCTLSGKALPYLDKPKNELTKIRQIRDARFSNDRGYMSAEAYFEIIQRRKQEFVAEYERESILSFNFADYHAFREITHPVSR